MGGHSCEESKGNWQRGRQLVSWQFGGEGGYNLGGGKGVGGEIGLQLGSGMKCV